MLLQYYFNIEFKLERTNELYVLSLIPHALSNETRQITCIQNQNFK